MPRKRTSREKGSIFIMALWFLTILSLFSVGLAQAVMQRMREFQHLERKRELRSALESAVNTSIADIMRVATGEDIPMDKVAAFKRLSQGEVAVDEAEGKYSVSEESIKLNLNVKDPLIWKRFLLQKAGRYLNDDKATDLAAEIVDFQDEDDFILNDYEKGSEKFAYQTKGLKNFPKNAAFESVGELRFVKGMSENVFHAIENYVTVYGNGQVNLNRADEALLETMGVHPGVVSKILDVRAGVDGIQNTSDDEYFKSVEQLYERLKGAFALSEAEHQSLQDMTGSNYFTFGPRYLKIIAEASLKGQKAKSQAVCIFDPKEGIKYWAEN